MGPDELDDLLASIRAESKGESALALYEGTRETDLVDEEIDERILKLLGLEDVFDIDYGTYTTLLKERLAASRNFEKKLSSEEDEILVAEFRRVKGKVGRFKLKKRKVTSEDIGVTGPIRVSSNKFLLAGKAVIPEQEAKEDNDDIRSIEKSLDAILKTLTLQNKEKKKQSENERKKSEDRRRRKREGELEKPLTQLKALAKKIIAPAQGILDRIFRFIKFTLLGYAFNQLVKWFSDPKNAEKIKTLGRFLKDWWPALLSAYVLFATPFGKFIRTTLKMLRGFIPQIARFVIKHPFLTATAAAGVGAYVMSQRNEAYRDELKQTEPSIVTPKETKETGKTPGVPQLQQEQVLQRGFGGMFSGGGLIKRKSFFGGGEVQKELNVNDIAFEGGGGITDDSGVKVKGAGPDTQLIAAAPGEVVMSRKAVDKYGANFFLDLNKRAGGTNIPKIANNIQLASGGGLVQKTIKTYQGGGMVGSTGSMNMMNRGMSFGGMMNRGMSFGSQTIKNISNSIQGTSTSASTSIMNSINSARQNLTNSPFGFNRPSSQSGDYKSSLSNSMSSKMPMSGKVMGMNNPQYKPYSQNISAIPMKNVLNSNMNMMKVEYGDVPNIQPIAISPQSRPTAPPGPPVIVSKTTFTVLPPIKAPSKAPSVARGSTLPEFIISGNSDTRTKIAMTLGIGDLVGVDGVA